jgi:nitroreductase
VVTPVNAGVSSVRHAAAHRRSIRAFSADPVPRADMESILRTTGMAPSAFNLQPWRFVVVQSPDRIAALVDAAYGQRQVASAPAVIVLYTDTADAIATVDEVLHPDLTPERRERARASAQRALADMPDAEREEWGARQAYIALGYLLLAAEDHGYHTSPMLGFDAGSVKALLNLPAHVHVPALVAIGHGSEEGRPHHRHPIDRIVRFA